eukprot:TRINITY_DN17660_c1_g1_i1.p2 TRINITY_DN17660_c1_g1~~TRINITY_DN17660_c1_g1_i1.p2  ORF type:complete len:175 (-),score=15.52 TRINITY_DN17660_c1_g1_i1:411-935(-)
MLKVHHLTTRADIVPHDFFDMVVATNVFEHLYNPWLAASNVYNMIKPGGVLLFTAPQLSIFHAVPNHYYGYTLQGAKYMLEEAGFCVLYAHGLMSNFVCVSHLMGFAFDDFDLEQLKMTDDILPCLVGVVALKPPNDNYVCQNGDYLSARELESLRQEWGQRVKAEQQEQFDSI